MKKNIKKGLLFFALLLLTMCVALTMAACGEDETQEPSPPDTPDTPSDTTPPVHTHTSAAVLDVVAPTCQEGGYTLHICLGCGEQYQTDFTEPSDAHIPLDEGVVTEPNCTERGYTTHICEVCDEEFQAEFTEPEADRHVAPVSGVVTNPDCTHRGYTTYTCTKCNQPFDSDYVRPNGHDRDTDGICTVCTDPGTYLRVNENGVEDPEGMYILFGTYPQTEVQDGDMSSTLTNLAGAVPTVATPGNWTGYTYRLTGDENAYMWYCDITHEGEAYRGVYMTAYRPSMANGNSGEGGSYQDDNGYKTDNIYWFRFEPIRWRILVEKDDVATLLCDLLLDAHEYDVNGTLWASSGIRTFLNNNFYHTAFNALQKELIQLTAVDNSASSVSGSEFYDDRATDTEDYVYLASQYEISTYLKNDADKCMAGTDYASAQGLLTSENNGELTGTWYLRSSYWGLRDGGSPTYKVGAVSADGFVGIRYDNPYSYYGVCPVICITL